MMEALRSADRAHLNSKSVLRTPCIRMNADEAVPMATAVALWAAPAAARGLITAEHQPVRSIENARSRFATGAFLSRT